MSIPVLPPEPGPRWHSVEVVTTTPHGGTVKRKVEGDDTWCAASLRALADQLDPPRPRPVTRQPADLGSMVRRGPGGMVAPPPSSDVPRSDPMSTR